MDQKGDGEVKAIHVGTCRYMGIIKIKWKLGNHIYGESRKERKHRK